MNVAELLRDGRPLILPTMQARCEAEVLTELAALLAGHHPGLSAEAVAEELAARERLGSTAIGDGLAIPHAKLPSAEKLLACFGRSERGVDFGSPDGHPTRFFFVLIAPLGAPGPHLTALAKISRLFKGPRLRARLRDARTAEELYAALAAEEGL